MALGFFFIALVDTFKTFFCTTLACVGAVAAAGLRTAATTGATLTLVAVVHSSSSSKMRSMGAWQCDGSGAQRMNRYALGAINTTTWSTALVHYPGPLPWSTALF